MNPVIMLGFAFIILVFFAGLFFSVYTLFRLVFSSIQGGLYNNLGLSSSPPGFGVDNSSIFLSAIFAAVVSTLIIVLGAIIVIKKGSLVRVVRR